MKISNIVLIVIVLLLSLIGCTIDNEKTAAESYLDKHTDAEILEHFEDAFLFYQDFAEPKDISTAKLLKFALFHAKDSWYNEADQMYYIPLADIYEILDMYLPCYDFQTDHLEDMYDDEKKQIVAGAIGMGTGNSDLDFVNAEIIDAENIKVTLLLHSLDGEDLCTEYLYITAEIIDGNAKFTSCQRIVN